MKTEAAWKAIVQKSDFNWPTCRCINLACQVQLSVSVIVHWKPSNPDTLGTIPSVLFIEVSWLQGLNKTQMYIPLCLLFTEVSWLQGLNKTQMYIPLCLLFIEVSWLQGLNKTQMYIPLCLLFIEVSWLPCTCCFSLRVLTQHWIGLKWLKMPLVSLWKEGYYSDILWGEISHLSGGTLYTVVYIHVRGNIGMSVAYIYM